MVLDVAKLRGEKMKVNYWILAFAFAIFGTLCAVGLIMYVFQERDKRSDLVNAFLIVMFALLGFSGVSQALHHLGKIFQ